MNNFQREFIKVLQEEFKDNPIFCRNVDNYVQELKQRETK